MIGFSSASTCVLVPAPEPPELVVAAASHGDDAQDQHEGRK